MEIEKGFTHDGESITGFSALCGECSSGNVMVNYKFNYYGGATGYDMSLAIECIDCDNKAELAI